MRERICIVVHKPITPKGQRNLMNLAATTHANAVLSHIRSLNCSNRQKLALIDAIIRLGKNP